MVEENKTKTEEKKEMPDKKTVAEKVVEKKTEKPESVKFIEGTAVVHGKDLSISTKHSIALCDFVRGKKPSEALTLLEKVLAREMAVPMRGEIPHKRNMPKGKVAGRYPINASRAFIKLVRNLIANASVKGLDVENLKISFAKADKASRPHKSTRMAFGRKRFKRTHVTLEAKAVRKAEKAKESKK